MTVIFSTIHRPNRVVWNDFVDTEDRSAMSRPAIFAKILKASRRYDILLLTGSVGVMERYVDLLAAAVVARLPSAPPVVLTDSLWGKGTSKAVRIGRIVGARLLDTPGVYFAVLASDEVDNFSTTWNIDKSKVFFTPYCHTLPDEVLARPTSTGGGVFAGGDSLRDHRPVIDAAHVVDAHFDIAAASLTAAEHSRVSTNTSAGPVDHGRFIDLLLGCDVAVVSLVDSNDRSAGMQTYLNAMAVGKPVIVSDVLGARDYLEHGKNAVLVPAGNSAALADAIRWVLDPVNASEVALMAEEGRRLALERYSEDAYLDRLLDLADGLLKTD